MSKSHDKYAINAEMVSDYMEVLVNREGSYDDAKDHAPERKESFYVKIKASAFINFEVQ